MSDYWHLAHTIAQMSNYIQTKLFALIEFENNKGLVLTPQYDPYYRDLDNSNREIKIIGISFWNRKKLASIYFTDALHNSWSALICNKLDHFIFNSSSCCYINQINLLCFYCCTLKSARDHW